MSKTSLISTGRHQYFYSDALQYFLYIPRELKAVIEEEKTMLTEPDNYYMRKLHFLQKYHFFDKEGTTFETNYSEELVRQNMACLRQLLIEVTDMCNLNCKYCGYGEFYSNYDKRENCNQTFENVKTLIDYLAKLWRSDYNVSHDNTATIGFYGGEPLMNMKLIKETIAYTKSLQISNLKFSYNMTTNAVLLDQHMDYLVENNFSILISLDGNEYHSGYRVDKQGKASFARVTGNIQKLKDTYPDFFEKNISFNAVLHDLNSVEECYHSINGLFGKTPRISQLNVTGIIPERMNEFFRMFNSKPESFIAARANEDIREELILEDTDSINYHTMLMNYGGNRFATYIDFFDSERDTKYVPTGTCKPFERKLFLTVHGKILPCEKIGQEHVIAQLSEGKLELQPATVAKYYSSLYEKVVKSCKHCYLKRSCGQCLFLLKEKDGQLICPGIQTDKKLRENFSGFLTYAERHPGDYERLLSSIIVD